MKTFEPDWNCEKMTTLIYFFMFQMMMIALYRLFKTKKSHSQI